MATLGQGMKNLQSKQQEHLVNAVEENSRPKDQNQKGKQNATQFCNYCRKSGHATKWRRKRIRDEEVEWNQMERIFEKKNIWPRTITENEGQAMDQNKGVEAKTFRTETPTTPTMDLWEIPPKLIRVSLLNQTPQTGTTIQIMEYHMINAQITKSISEYKQSKKISDWIFHQSDWQLVKHWKTFSLFIGSK